MVSWAAGCGVVACWAVVFGAVVPLHVGMWGCGVWSRVVWGGIFALRAHCALLLDYVPPEEPPSTPLGNALRIR